MGRIGDSLRSIYGFLSFGKLRLFSVIKSKEIADAPSYYPECDIKNGKEQIKDNKRWAFKFGEVNTFYNLYGLDVKNSNSELFLDNNFFMSSRNKMNHYGEPSSQIPVLRDKWMFYCYMNSNGFPVPEVFGIIISGKLYGMQMIPMKYEDLKDEKDYFIKDVDGECASYVKHIKDYSCLEREIPFFKGNYILQKRVFQNEEMSRLNSGAINTLRIITVKNGDNVKVLSALLRVGTSKTESVDNWAAGGIAVGVESDGRLKEYGFYKPIHGLKTNCHPDSKIYFRDFIVPYYNEACEIVCKAHRLFYSLGAIGWDIAITDNGPVFIEGNDNFEISLNQACDRPLKNEWLSLISEQ